MKEQDKKRKIELKIGGKTHSIDLEKQLMISEATIDEDLTQQASLFVWYSILHETAEAEYRDAKLALEMTEASLDSEFRKTIPKLTEKKLASLIVLDDRYLKAKEVHDDRRATAAKARVVKEGFNHRKDMLITLASNMRARHDAEIWIKEREAKKS